MNKEQAKKLINDALASMRLTLKEHQVLQQALHVLAKDEPVSEVIKKNLPVK